MKSNWETGGMLEDDARAAKDSFLIPASLLLSMAVFTAYAFAVKALFFTGASAEAAKAAALFIPELRKHLQPEPLERHLYLVGLLCIAALPILFYVLLTRLEERSCGGTGWWKHPTVCMTRDMVLGAGLLLWLFTLSGHLHIPLLGQYFLAACILALAIPRLIRIRAPSWPWLVRGLAGALILFFGCLMLIGDKLNETVWHIGHHFDIPLGAVNQVLHGKTILVDVSSQYGILYPYVLAVPFHFFELSVARLSFVFASLCALSLLFLYMAVRERVGGDRPLSVLFFLAILGIVHPFYQTYMFRQETWYLFPYYQYFPLRVICGAFFIWFVPVYLRLNRPLLTALGYVAAGFSLLWNTDTGGVILIAWTATLIFRALAGWREDRRRAIKAVVFHAVVAALVLVASLAAYWVFARVRAGQWPSWQALTEYQRIFYVSGYLMLPMQFWTSWQAVMLIYVATVFFCLRRLAHGRADQRTAWYLFLALYGLGTFTYYQGRSHVYNLLNVAFPAMMLGCFLFADALEESPASKWREILRQPDLRYRFIKVAAFSLIMFVGLVNTVKGFPAAIGFGRELAGWLRMPPDTQVTDELRKYVGGSDTIIVARTPNAEHVKTRSYSALTDCSLPQIMLLSQLKEVQELLDRGTVRYVILFRGRPQIDTSERLSFARYHRVADVGGEAMVLERNGPALNF